MEDANTQIAELGSIQKLIEKYVEGLKNGMATLQPRPIKPIARRKKETKREEDERGQKRGASESPKIGGFSNTRSKPRLMSNRTRSADNVIRRSEQNDDDKSSEVDQGDWKTVPLKKRKRKKKKNEKKKQNPQGKRTRPSAIAIKVADGKSFADVVVEIQKNVNPDDHGVAIRNLTKTRDGNVLIEIAKTDNGTEAFQEAIATALGDSGKIKNLVPKLSVEIRDLDVGTSATEATKSQNSKRQRLPIR